MRNRRSRQSVRPSAGCPKAKDSSATCSEDKRMRLLWQIGPFMDPCLKVSVDCVMSATYICRLLAVAASFYGE